MVRQTPARLAIIATMNPLEIRNATIARSNQTLIADLNLRVEPGEVLTLMGVSGSGRWQ